MRRAVEDAGALETRERGHVQLPVSRAGGDHDGPGLYDLSIGEMHPIWPLVAIEPDGRPRDGHLGAEFFRLGERASGERQPGDPGGESQIVLDPRARPGLSSRCGAFQDQHIESLRRGVYRRAQARRSPAHDDDVPHRPGIQLRRQSER